MFDVSKLTLGEIAKFEDLSNMSINMLEKDEAPKGRALAALAFVVKRRTGDPKFTWAEAQDLTIDQANKIIGFTDDGEDSKTEGASAPKVPKKSAPKK